VVKRTGKQQKIAGSLPSVRTHIYIYTGNAKGGSITVQLTSCLTGLESAVWQLKFFCFYLQNRLIQTSKTGGQRYSDTSPFSIPCIYILGFMWVLRYLLNLSRRWWYLIVEDHKILKKPDNSYIWPNFGDRARIPTTQRPTLGNHYWRGRPNTVDLLALTTLDQLLLTM
jgi:hypothetical protein